MNVLLVTVDQFRAEALSCAGHRLVRTPNIDELAAEGVRFARHYSQAAPCAPGRAALYTGTYQFNNRVVFNGAPLDDRFDNVARLARRVGHDPVLFGYTDQGVDPRTVAPDDPRLSTYEGVLPGFDCLLDLTGKREPWAQWVRAAGYDMPDDPDEALATESQRPAELGISAFLTDEFLRWVDSQSSPWFAHISHLRPHPPFAAAGRWATAFDPDDVDLPVPAVGPVHELHTMLLDSPWFAAPSDERGLRHLRAQYYGMIGDVDEQLGRVWQALRATGQWERTIVILTSDHGEQLGDNGLVEKMGWFEPSYHVPCIVRDPRRPESAGDVIDVFTENVDVFPTLCELLGADIPRQCDGRSLVAFLERRTPEEWRDAAYWEFDWRLFQPGATTTRWPADRRGARHNLAVRRSADTAYVQFADGRSLLYDCVADPHWQRPLDDPAQAFDEARAMLAWRAEHTERTLTGRFLLG